MSKNPMFLQFLNREKGVIDLLTSFSRSKDERTSSAAQTALSSPPDLEEFRSELNDAVRDLISEGIGNEFKAFVDHYLDNLEEDLQIEDTPRGQNRSQTARVKNDKGPWVQGLICYNLVLYVKAFGLENLKSCKVCGKIFAHKGKYAVYCSDACKSRKGQ